MKRLAATARQALEDHFRLRPDDTPMKLAARAEVHFTTVYNILRGRRFRSDTWDKLEPHLMRPPAEAA